MRNHQRNVLIRDGALSSLGRCEAHVLDSLSAVTEAVSRIAGQTQRAFPVAGWKARTAQHLAEQTADIFGRDPAGPRSRIMVTIGADQAHARQVGDLIAAGADCIRINCAHDDQRVWTDIIAQTRNAATTLKRDCRVLMDIAGPKVRIADVEGPGKNRVHAGDELLLVGSANLPEKPKTVAVAITHAAIVKQLKAGHRISLDDGKLQGVVTARSCRRHSREHRLSCAWVSVGTRRKVLPMRYPGENWKNSIDAKLLKRLVAGVGFEPTTFRL